MNIIISKLLSQVVGDGILYKVLGSILIAVLSFGGFILKHFHDLDIKASHLSEAVEHLSVDNELLRKQLDENLKIITQNQEIMLKHNHLIVEDNSYWQYLTMRNLFIFLGLGGAALAGFWVWSILSSNQDLYTALFQQLTSLKEIINSSTTTLSKVNADGFDRQLTVLDEALKKLNEIYNLILDQGIEINKINLSTNISKNKGFIIGNGNDVDNI